MERIMEINGTKLRVEREAIRDLTQVIPAEKARVPVKALIAAETRDSISEEHLKRLCTVLGASPDVFATVELVGTARHEVEEITNTILKALVKAHHAGRDAVERPHSIPNADRTLPSKITDRSKVDDPTEPVDVATGGPILKTILSEAKKQGHPLREGFDYIEEESGHQRVSAAGYSAQGHPKHCVFVDSADDTSQFRRNLGGTSLIGVYRHNVGWICAAAVDAVHARLFSAIRGLHPTAEQLPASPPNGSAVRGRALHLGPSGRKTLRGACANLYLGKPYRILEAATTYAKLLSEANGIRETVSYGGSRGALLCAQGVIDVAVEMKGFRLIDCIPGAFIAKHSGCSVVDESGQPFRFGVDRELELVLASGSGDRIVEHVTKCRRKFICAATDALAQQVHSQL